MTPVGKRCFANTTSRSYQAQYEARLKQAVETARRRPEWDFQVTEFKGGLDLALEAPRHSQ